MTESSQEREVNSSTTPFMKEQLEHLDKLFQSPQFSVNPSCSLAQTGNYLTTILSSVKSNPSYSWIIDSGATDHMIGCSTLFSSYGPCARNKKIRIADGSLLAIAEIGSIKILSSFTLSNVLHVPNLSCNLLSISKITHDHNCHANFFQSQCEFQEMDSGRMIGSAREYGGLYFFKDGMNQVNKSKVPVLSLFLFLVIVEAL